MGVDISMSIGYGVHIPEKIVERFLEEHDPDGNGFEDTIFRLLPDLRGVEFDWPGNGWLGEDNGWIVFLSETMTNFDMGREAQAGVYRPAEPVALPSAFKQLDSVLSLVADEELKLEWLVSVGVH